MQAADDVQIHVVLIEFQPQPLFQHGNDQAHPVVVDAVGCPSRCGERGLRHQCLNLRNQRSCPLQRADGTVAGNVPRAPRKQHLRGVFDLQKPPVGHLKHADFVGRAVAVFDGADDAVGLLALSFEIQHRVHHMLQHLRSRNAPFLVDVPDHDDRHSLPLRLVDEGQRRLLDLRHAARRGVDGCGIDGLNGVNDHHIRLDPVGFRKNFFDVRFGQDEQVLSAHPQPPGAELELTARFLARHIQHPPALAQRIADLHQKRGFTDARLAGKQDDRPVHQSAAQHAVQLPKPGILPHISGDFQIRKPHRAVVGGGRDHAGPLACRACGRRTGRGFLHILGKGIPSPAAGTLSKPFRRLICTFRADVHCSQTLHPVSVSFRSSALTSVGFLPYHYTAKPDKNQERSSNFPSPERMPSPIACASCSR